MKQLIALILLVLATVGLQAQRIDPMLSRLMAENAAMLSRMRNMKVQGTGNHQTASGIDTTIVKTQMEACFNEDCTVRSVVVIAFLNKGAALPVSELSEAGIKVTMHSGSTVIMNVPAEAYDILSQMKCFESLYASKMNKLCNDNAREMTSVAYVTGEKVCNELPAKYNGEGVIVGIIDQGIDFNHAAFLNPEDGTTRIKEAITFERFGEDPIITTGNDIYELTSMYTGDSHGTHVSATAAGSDVAGLGLQGMAPKADLILADLGDYLWASRIINTTNEMFHYADSVGKPIVINLSLGFNYDYHDGNKPEILFLRDNVGEGKIVCICAGNEAAYEFSIDKTLGKAGDDGYQLKFIYDTEVISDDYPVYDAIKFLIYADKPKLDVDIRAVNVKTGEVFTLDEKPFYYYSGGEANKLSFTTDTTKAIANYKLSFLARTLCFHEKDLRLGVFVKGEEGTRVTVMNDTDFNYFTYLRGRRVYPNLTDYEDGSGDKSINTLACDDALISVGAYVQRPSYTNISGEISGEEDNQQEGRIATFSSYGIDDNGIARPDVLAPGMWTISAYNLYDNMSFNKQELDPSRPNYKYLTHWLTAEELGNNYTRPSGYGVIYGTSMATPVATGIVALWLQANPSLTPADVRKIAKATCINDEWTTDVSNIPSGNIVQAGAGKIDALQGIKYIEDEIACQIDENITSRNSTSTNNAPAIYNLQGQRVGKAYRGIIIINGKKYSPLPTSPRGGR